jgi:hypothetical protein
MLAGVVAGLLVFLFARIFGEPLVDQAIAFEDAMSRAAGEVQHPELVGRSTQAGIGLFTAVMVYGIGMGGLFALVFAFVQQRFSTWSVRSTSAAIAVAALVAIVLVPAVKYPSNPPAVGSPETIGERTRLFFLMITVSIASLVAAIALARRLLLTLGAWNAAVVSGLAYVMFIGVVQYSLPTVNEVPEGFPAALLWQFRLSSLAMHGILWLGIGITFGALAESESTAPSKVDVRA